MFWCDTLFATPGTFGGKCVTRSSQKARYLASQAVKSLHRRLRNCSGTRPSLLWSGAAVFCLVAYTGPSGGQRARTDNRRLHDRVCGSSPQTPSTGVLRFMAKAQTLLPEPNVFARYKGERRRRSLAAGFPSGYTFFRPVTSIR